MSQLLPTGNIPKLNKRREDKIEKDREGKEDKEDKDNKETKGGSEEDSGEEKGEIRELLIESMSW
jgi:hypothetical protein